MNDLQRNIIRNMKETRKRKNITQAKLSELVNKSIGFIGDIESARTLPSLKTLEEISIALEIQPYELLLPKTNSLSEKTLLQNLLHDLNQLLNKYNL